MRFVMILSSFRRGRLQRLAPPNLLAVSPMTSCTTTTTSTTTTTTFGWMRCFSSSSTTKSPKGDTKTPKEATEEEETIVIPEPLTPTTQMTAPNKLPEPEGTYLERKQILKEQRRQIYAKRMELKERRKHRRDHAPKGVKKEYFRQMWLPKKIHEEYLNRQARQAGLDWDYEVAVILQRWNILLPELEPWRQQYYDLEKKLYRYKAPHFAYPRELQLYPDADPNDPLSSTDTEHKETPLSAQLREQVASYFPDGYVHPKSRITQADLEGNVRTTNRKLDDWLYLITKQPPPKKTQDNSGDQDAIPWSFPTTPVQDGETLVDAGRRLVLQDILVPDAKEYHDMLWYAPSFCPVAVDMKAYPPPSSYYDHPGKYGIKTFFMRFYHYLGDMHQTPPTLLDYAWLTKQEILEKLKQQQKQEDEMRLRFYEYLI